MTPTFYETLKRVHIELTQKCNASCGQCARNHHGSGITKAGVSDAELSLEDIKKIMPPEFVQQLKHILINGTYGDICMVTEAIEICEYLRSCNPKVFISIHTNGGARGSDWWKRLAATVSEIKFGIDGLEDTHHLYRRGTLYAKVIQHAQAAISAGVARIVWKLNVFEHNQHQVEECERRSKELGFSSFEYRKSSRFISVGGATVQASPVMSRDGQKVEYYLKPPTLSQYRNELVNPDVIDQNPDDEKSLAAMRNSVLLDKSREGIGMSHEDAKKYLENTAPWLHTTKISCRSINENAIYIDAVGRVWPCCHLGREPNTAGIISYQNLELFKQVPGGEDSINGKFKSIKEIVEGEFYKRITESWDKKFGEGRLSGCAVHCGSTSLCMSQDAKPTAK